MHIIGYILSIAGILVLVGILLIVLILEPAYIQYQQQEATETGISSSVLANAALELQGKLTGPRANVYDPADTLLRTFVIPFWQKTCQNQDGTLCDLAKPGNLNCVEFVTAVYGALANDPLPVHPNAVSFWSAYQGKAGWQEIPSPSAFQKAPHQAPNLGDLVVWKGGRHAEKQPNGTTQDVEYGHIGIVVGWHAPSATKNDGSLEVAESNAAGNKWPAVSLNPYIPSPQAGNTYTMTVNQDYTINTWGAYIDRSTTPPTAYSAFTVLGFIHQIQAPQTIQTDANAMTLPVGVSAQNQYVQMAINAATHARIPTGYFVRQIQQESHFNPAAVSPAGAEGIAQFEPGTAAGLGINPWDPSSALQGAAQMMATALRENGGDYAKALASYNAGPGAVSAAEQQAANAVKGGQTGATVNWETYLPPETKSYIQAIMGA